MIEDVIKRFIEYRPEKFLESLEMIYNQVMQIEDVKFFVLILINADRW